MAADQIYPSANTPTDRPPRYPTIRARLGGRKPGVDADEVLAVPFGLALEHGNQSTSGRLERNHFPTYKLKAFEDVNSTLNIIEIERCLEDCPHTFIAHQLDGFIRGFVDVKVIPPNEFSIYVTLTRKFGDFWSIVEY